MHQDHCKQIVLGLCKTFKQLRNSQENNWHNIVLRQKGLTMNKVNVCPNPHAAQNFELVTIKHTYELRFFIAWRKLRTKNSCHIAL